MRRAPYIFPVVAASLLRSSLWDRTVVCALRGGGIVLVWWLSIAIAPVKVMAAEAVWIDVEGAIGPATRDYFDRALTKAVERGAALFVVRMDTPGGLDTSMRDIVKSILESPIPVVTYVAPSGARAASAGTFLLYASHVAAMAPATNVGAATPVQMGGGPGPRPQPGEAGSEQERPADNDSAMRRKVVNDAVAYITSLAQARGRNAQWAEQAVREGAALGAEAALAEGVIDVVAKDMADLLSQLNGRKMRVATGEITLATEGMVLVHVEPDWRNRLLAIITDPNIAYILMLIGIYGLIFELANPGALLPGTAGAICLLLALFAFQLLPVNYAGLALMLLGVALMVGEAFVPSFGALGIGGGIAFVIGSIILMDTDVPGYGISIPLVAAFALSASAVFTVVLVMAVKARRQPVVSGAEELLGATAIALSDFVDGGGTVWVHGEQWNARAAVPITRSQRLRVVKIEGLTVWVEPANENAGRNSR